MGSQVLVSGILFSINSEPKPLQVLSDVLPLTYAVNGLRDVMIKGADLTWGSLQLDVGVVAGFIVLLVVAAGAPPRRRIAQNTAPISGAAGLSPPLARRTPSCPLRRGAARPSGLVH